MSGFNPSIGDNFSSNFFQQIGQFRNQNIADRLTLNNLANQQLQDIQNSQQAQQSDESDGLLSGHVDNSGPRGRMIETGRQEDIRAQGDQFIALGSGNNQRFTRSVSLEVGDNGNVTDDITDRRLQETTQNAEGETVTQDFQLSDSQMNMDARSTTEAEIGGNISRLTGEGESVQFEGELTNSEGNAETISFEATRTGDNQIELTAEDPQTGDNALQATVNFNDEGSVDNTSVQENGSGFEGLSINSENGSEIQVDAENLDFSGLSLNFGDNTAGVTNENGTEGGELESLTVTEQGQLQGDFSNGQSQEFGEIASATFDNNNELSELNDGTFVSNEASGEANFSGEAQFNSGELETQNNENTRNVVNELLGETGDPSVTSGLSRGELLGSALDLSV